MFNLVHIHKILITKYSFNTFFYEKANQTEFFLKLGTGVGACILLSSDVEHLIRKWKIIIDYMFSVINGYRLYNAIFSLYKDFIKKIWTQIKQSKT